MNENYKANIELEDKLQDCLASVMQHANNKAIDKHLERGKLLARQRIDILIDQDAQLIELSALAAINQYNNEFPSAGIITGIGNVHGIPCMIIANDATVKGGTYIKETIKKHIRAQEIAQQNNLPCIYLVDSGGIYLPEQANVFPDRFDFGRVFYNQARMSAQGIPQISVVMGSCTAGGAYVPAMSDQTIIVKEQGTIFVGGPPLVKAATGEEVTAEQLGGAYVHTSISGVADYLANDDLHALKICRDIIADANLIKPADRINKFNEPLKPIEELYELVPCNNKSTTHPYDIIDHICDGNSFNEFKKEYAANLVTGFASLTGNKIGIIGNNGYLNADAARKGAHFIELCDQRKIPLLFLQNITGFIVGKSHEHQGIARDGAKLIQAVANTGVPKITLVSGGSYGAGNYAMAGRAFNPEFLLLWPNAKVGVMGGQQAASVLNSLKNDNQNGQNTLAEQLDKESSAYYSTSRLWDDGIIEIKNTRYVLGRLFSLVSNKPITSGKFGVFRM